VVGLGDRRRHVLRAVGLTAPLHVRTGERGRLVGAEERARGEHGAGLLPGHDEQRNPVPERVEHRAERMPDPAGGMEHDDARAAGTDGMAGGHADHDRLLQAEHVGDVVGPVAHHAQFGGSGVAEHRVDTGLTQEPEHRFTHVHRCSTRAATSRAQPQLMVIPAPPCP
jgi:hypothetical protein